MADPDSPRRDAGGDARRRGATVERRRTDTAPLLLLAFLVSVGCGNGDPGRSRGRPPLGRWPLTELDGEIRSRFGGRPVLCLEGSLLHRPAPLYTGPPEVRSFFELLPEGELDFAFYFEDANDYDVISTDSALPPIGFLGEALGSSTLRVAASWSWSDRTLDGTVEALPGEDELRARFVVQGRFEGADQIAGEWSFEARSKSGSCWGRLLGRGAFRAAPAE